MIRSSLLIGCLATLQLSCSKADYEAGASEYHDGESAAMLAEEFRFQTFEDQSFDMRSLSELWHSDFTVELISEPEVGSLQRDADSEGWMYIPTANAFGEDIFEVSVTSPNGVSFRRRVVANIISVNDAPSADDVILRLPADEEIEFIYPVHDVEGASIAASIELPPNHGLLEFSPDTMMVRYTPDPGYRGMDSIALSFSDGESETLSFIDFEVLDEVGNVTATDGMHEVRPGETLAAELNWQIAVQDDVEISIDVTENVNSGLLIINPNSKDFTYRPNLGFTGRDSFKYRVRAGNTFSNIATVYINVGEPNRAPELDDPIGETIIIHCPRYEACYGELPASDAENHKIYHRLVSPPESGTMRSWYPHLGQFTYLPPEHNDLDEDRFTFYVEDCFGGKSPVYTAIIKFTEKRLILHDSFERHQVMKHEENFHWRFLVDDNGKGIEPREQDCRDHICAKIFKEGDYNIGPAAHEERSLFMFGREGHSNHDIFLMSKNFDLSGFSSVDIDFSYLIMDIGDNDSKHGHHTDEYLKAEVCLYGAYECGLEPLDPVKLRSEKWITIFENEDSTENNDLNGRNHSRHDWQEAHARVNLDRLENEYPGCHRQNFVFRFRSRLQDGFEGNSFHNHLEDAVAVDDLKITAGSSSVHH